jgi:hypothetical protein
MVVISEEAWREKLHLEISLSEPILLAKLPGSTRRGLEQFTVESSRDADQGD